MKNSLLFAFVISLLSVTLASTTVFAGNKGDIYNNDPEDRVQVFLEGNETLNLLAGLKELDFGNDSLDGSSIGKVIAYINEHRDLIVPNGDKEDVPKLTFYPASMLPGEEHISKPGKVSVTEDSVAIRLQQAAYFYLDDGTKNRKKVYVPFIGAEIVAFVAGGELGEDGIYRGGKLLSLNSSIVDIEDSKSLAISLRTASFEILKNATDQDRYRVLELIRENALVDGSFASSHFLAAFTGQKSEKDQISSLFNDKELLYSFVTEQLAQNPESIRLVMTKVRSTSRFEAAWRIQNPFGFPATLFVSASELRKNKLLKVVTNVTHATVTAYKGTLEKMKKKKKRSGDSSVWSKKKLKKESKSYDEVMVNLSKAIEWYKDSFSWNSVDNRGGKVDATVGIKHKLFRENAGWLKAPYNQFLFGKGASSSKKGVRLGNFTNTLDLIGHEFMHAIITHSTDLVKDDQPGALNEHIADIMGVGFEAELKGIEYDYAIGREVILNNGDNSSLKSGLRDFLNPESALVEQPVNMSEAVAEVGNYCVADQDNDFCGVHYQCGVPNRAVGMAIKELGWEKVKPIIFTVATKKLRSSSDFSDYRRQVEAECNYSLTEEECAVFSTQFESVGIGAETTTQPTEPGSDDIQIEICNILKDLCALADTIEMDKPEGCAECGF